MPVSAGVFSRLFTPVPEVFLAAPSPQAQGSPFKYSGLVPWLRFTVNGLKVERNAGQLATYWVMVGVSDPMAEAMLDISYTAPF